jgi:hypothetical protein
MRLTQGTGTRRGQHLKERCLKLRFRLRHAVTMILCGPKDHEAVRISSWRHGNLPRELVTNVFPGIEHTSVSIRRTFDRKIGMSLDANELLVLVAIVKHIKARHVLEVGTFDGNTALNLAENVADDGSVVTIDLPPTWNGSYALPAGNTGDNSHRRLDARFRAGGYDPTLGRQFHGHQLEARIRQVLSDSAQLEWSTLPQANLVFIDGNHSYEYVKSDTENALKILAPGGIIVWHDYGQIPSVSRCVDEFAGRLNVRALRGTRLAVGFT